MSKRVGSNQPNPGFHWDRVLSQGMSCLVSSFKVFETEPNLHRIFSQGNTSKTCCFGSSHPYQCYPLGLHSVPHTWCVYHCFIHPFQPRVGCKVTLGPPVTLWVPLSCHLCLLTLSDCYLRSTIPPSRDPMVVSPS